MNAEVSEYDRIASLYREAALAERISGRNSEEAIRARGIADRAVALLAQPEN